MKKHLIYSILLVLFTIFGCNNDDIIGNHTDIQEAPADSMLFVPVLEVSLGEKAETRMLYTERETEAGLELLAGWAAEDQLSVHDLGKTVTYSLNSGAGTNKGTFITTESVTANRAYYIYHPSSIKDDRDYLRFSYKGQVQRGNNNGDHLSAYHVIRQMQSSFSSNIVLGKSYEDFKQSSCLKYNLTLPKSIVPKSIELSAFHNGQRMGFLTMPSYYIIRWTTSYLSGYWDDYEEAIQYNVQNTLAYSLELGIENVSSTQQLTAYMMMADDAISFTAGDVIRITVTDSTGEKYYTEKTVPSNVSFASGTYNVLTVNSEATWVNIPKEDGVVTTLQTATAPGIVQGSDIIIVGDGFIKEDITNGTYENVMRQAYDDFFCIEPFTTLKPYFNVYYVNAISPERLVTTAPSDGINGAGGQSGNTIFKSQFSNESTRLSGDDDAAKYYAMKALGNNASERIKNALVLIMVNAPRYAGTCWNMWYNDGNDYASSAFSTAYIPLGFAFNGVDANTNRRRILHHEANGHGFGKLGDEYTGKSGSFYTSEWDNLDGQHELGLFRNVSKYVSSSIAAANNLTQTNTTNVYWSNLYGTKNNYEGISNTDYRLGIYQGANTWNDFFCRSSKTSIMVNNQGAFNAMSRWTIWYRLMRLTGKIASGTFAASKSAFLDWDKPFINYVSAETRSATPLSPEAVALPLAEPVYRKGHWKGGEFIEDKYK